MRKYLLHSLFVLGLFLAHNLTSFANNLKDNETCLACITAPVLICPSTYFGCPFDNLDPSNTGVPMALPGDPDCPAPIVSYTDVVVTDSLCLKIIHRTWLAEYPPGSASIKLHSQCQQTIILNDTDAPIIENCPNDVLVDLSINCDSTAIWQVPTATDNCGIQYFLTTNFSGTTFPQGQTTVTYTALDFCGQSDTCSFNVTVFGYCCDSLLLICPSDASLCIGEDISPSNTGMATGLSSDPGCPALLISYSDTILNTGPCSGSMEIQRTWTGVDASDSLNVLNCIQTIIVSDTIPPVISNLPPDITLTAFEPDCQAPLTWLEPNAADNCELFSFVSDIPNGSLFSEGDTLVTYTAVDNCGNFSIGTFQVTVICIPPCLNAPNLTCPPAYTSCPSVGVPNPIVSGFPTATPGSVDCGQPILLFSDNIISSGPCLGEQVIERTWIASDPLNSALSSSCVQLITLEDNDAPQISGMPTDITISGFGNNCQVPVQWTEPAVSDNCGISSMSSDVPNGTWFQEGINTITYTAQDLCGLSATASFNITINCISLCQASPILNCPAGYWACPTNNVPSPDESGWATAEPGSDDCNDPIVTYSDLVLITGTCSGSQVIQRTWTASDPSDPNNTTTCTQLISLEDLQAPYIQYCPNDIVVNATSVNCSVPVTWTNPVASDNCSLPDISVVNQHGSPVANGSTFNQGTTTVTYTATDLCGNTATCQFDVTVVCPPSCNTPPVISCPANASVCPGSSTSPSLLGWASATPGANCPNPNLTLQDIITSTGPCAGQKVIHRTWTASYGYGNTLTSSCVQVIKVEDKVAPSFSNCPQNIIVPNNTTIVNWTTPYATDYCSTPTVTSTHQSGTYFPVGTTYVTYTAVDKCGNSAQCQFSVKVLNNNTATLTCPNDIILTCGANGGAIANWSPPTYTGTCNNCNNGYYIPGFIYMGTFAGNQYYCSVSQATWPVANQVCNANGGYLAKINNAAENAFLANVLTLQSAWIGLSDHISEGNFKWTDGQPISYSNWYPGQPNDYNSNQDYVEMLNNGEWNDQYNTYSLEYIMELPCTNIQQISGPTPGTFLTGGNYTVTYSLNDACGASATCSFDITVTGGLTLTCPANINTSAPQNSPGVVVDWNAPYAHSCCSDCNSNAGGSISGFVYMGSHNGHHYYCSTQAATWNSARQTCVNKGGHLAVINDAAENAFLANVLTLQSAWIGCSDYTTEGSFEWVNGDALSYTNWYPGQPNNYNNDQDYVELLNNGQWNDQYNSYSLEYIMELPGCLNVTQTAGPSPGSLLAPGSSHVVSYLATDGCGNSKSCSFNINVASIPVATDYCDSYGIISFNYFIDSVVFGQLNNHSGDDGGYGDYTSTCYNITEGQAYPLQLDPGFESITTDKVYWKVWIDYNMNGIFENNNEYVAYGCGENALSGVVVMPDKLHGGKTRMRVIMKPGSYPTGPCDILQYGETEDYCLLMIGTASLSDNEEIESRSKSDKETGPSQMLPKASDVFEVFVNPNPAVDYINVKLSDLIGVEGIELLDLDGRIIQRIEKADIMKITQIDISSLNSGMKLISVFKEDGTSITQKVLIQK